MKKKFLFCLLASTMLVSCSGKDNNSSSSPEIEKTYYATVNSTYDSVNIYAIVNETFDISDINYSYLFTGTPSINANSEYVQVDGTKLTFLKKGITEITVSDEENIKSFKINVSINDSKETRYDYPAIDLTNYVKQNELASTVNATTTSVTLTAEGSQWNRITYELADKFNTNYSVECDVTFISTDESSRWFGIVFRDQETETNKYPFFQFDFRQNSGLSNAIEVTYMFGAGAGDYNYPYAKSWTNGGPGVMNNGPMHIKFTLDGADFKGSISYGEYTEEISVTLPNISSGNIGFQCAGSVVKFENLKVGIVGTEKVTSSANTSESLVKISDNNNSVDPLKPQIISSGKTIDEIYGISAKSKEWFVRLNNRQVYDLNNELMKGVTLNSIIENFRGDSIPNIQVEDEKSLNVAIEVLKSFGIVDVNLWSTNGAILDLARNTIPYARLGYIPTNVTSFETFEEISPICLEAGKHYANLILLDSALLNKENVLKTVLLGYSVVANAKNGDNYSLIAGALAGCKLILANYNQNVQQQAGILYSNDIFTIDTTAHSLLSVPAVAGHRGAGTDGTNPSVTLPENTIESFTWAFEHGANSIEIDVHTTSDKKLIVTHDDTTGRVSNQNLTIKNATLATLQALPLKVGSTYSTEYHMPSLEEVFDAFKGDNYKDKTIMVEIKDNLVETGIASIEMAKEMGWYGRINLITFSSSTAQTLRDYDPSIQVSYLGTVQRRNVDEYWASANSYLNSGVGLASQLSTVSNVALKESNARGQMYWLWTFETGNASQLFSLISDGNRAFTVNYLDFFAKSQYKLFGDESITLKNNESKQLTIKAMSYDKTETVLNDASIIVLSNNATVNGNTITRTGKGDIYVAYKAKVQWNLYNSPYYFYIYSDIVVIK